MRVVVNEDMKVFDGHVPLALKKGQEISGPLAEMLAVGARRKVTVVDEPAVEEAADDPEVVDEPADKLNIDGKIEDVLAWVGDNPERALEAHAAEEAKGEKARPRLLSKLAELIDEA